MGSSQLQTDTRNVNMWGDHNVFFGVLKANNWGIHKAITLYFLVFLWPISGGSMRGSQCIFGVLWPISGGFMLLYFKGS